MLIIYTAATIFTATMLLIIHIKTCVIQSPVLDGDNEPYVMQKRCKF